MEEKGRRSIKEQRGLQSVELVCHLQKETRDKGELCRKSLRLWCSFEHVGQAIGSPRAQLPIREVSPVLSRVAPLYISLLYSVFWEHPKKSVSLERTL